MMQSGPERGGKRPYVPPLVESEIIQDLSAGGCGKCPSAGVDTSACPSEDPISTS